MIAAFVIAAIVGGGLVLASFFGALGDQGIDHSGHLDQSGHLDHLGDPDTHVGDFHSLSALTILSVRFWIYAVAGFGLIGLLLRAFHVGSAGVQFAAAIFGGILAAVLVQTLFRAVANQTAGSSAAARTLVGATGYVTVAVRSGVPGKVRLQVQGQTVEILATSDAAASLGIGEEILVVSVNGQHAEVVPIHEIPQVHKAPEGQVGPVSQSEGI